MAARITRAKKKIAAARIPYRVPPVAELPERVDAVLTVVHLLYSTGYAAPAGDELMRTDLAERSLDLARMLHGLLASHPEVTGLLALILLTDARRDARVDRACGWSCCPSRIRPAGTRPRSLKVPPWSGKPWGPAPRAVSR